MSLPVRPSAVATLALPIVALLGIVTFATAAVAPEDKCEAAKLRETGKLASCVLSSLARTTQAGDGPNQTALDACDAKFGLKVGKAETAAAGACPTTGDTTALEDAVAALADSVKASVSGVRFIDNGDGTVTDTEEGLTWQKQVAGSAAPSGVDQLHTAADMLAHLGAVNGSGAEGLGNRDDWGLPTLAQLQSILECSAPPCVFKSSVLGPNPTLGAVGPSYMMTGETDFIPLTTVPCLKVIALEDGTVDCKDLPSTEGRSKVRTNNNAR